MQPIALYTDKAPSVDLTVYRKEIYNFLNTVTIKYDPLVEACNDTVERKGGQVDKNLPSSWKYYKNIIGEYHPTDTPMYVVSFDTQEKILFSKENLLKSPRTMDNYSVGESYYDELCQLYPSQTDLIKGIRYPLDNWEDAYRTDNLSYIKGDETLFELNERDSLIEQLKKTLRFIDDRWNFPGTSVEPLYPWVFWGEIWHILATALFAQRVENIRHSSVHSWHMWQYITSQGLSDYSDLLSFTQSTFLYRNLNYLNLNRGKHSNLIILANNLLNEWALTLYGRDVIQRSDIGSKQALLYPDLIAKVIETNNPSQTPIPPSSVEDMVYKLINVGDELSSDQYNPYDNSKRQERLLSDTTVNTYPTKVVEIAPVDKNKKYTKQFDTYIYDSLIYGISTGEYNPIVELPSKINQQVVLLSAKDILLLFNYCMIRSLNQVPKDIPFIHKSALALKPYPINMIQTYKLDGFPININSYVNVDDYTNHYFQMDYKKNSPKEFSKELLKGFETIVHQVSLQRLNADDRVGRMMRLISKNMLIIGDVKLNLTDRNDYDDWLNSHPDLKSLILDPIDSDEKTATSQYQSLAADLVDTLVPIIPEFNQYGDFQVSNDSYQRIKQLFVQLTSYNITFVDDNTASPEYYFLPQFWSSVWDEKTDGDVFYDVFDYDVHLSEKFSDKLVNRLFDELIILDKDVFDESSVFDEHVSSPNIKLIKSSSYDDFYNSCGKNTTVSDIEYRDHDISIKMSGTNISLNLPDAPTPL